MGLDVCAVIKWEIVEDPKVSETEDLVRVYQPSDFLDHLGEQLKDDQYLDNIICGDSDFRIGYGGHSHFREMLARFAGFEKYVTTKPDFSDPDFYNKNHNYNFPYCRGMYEKEDLSYGDDFVALIHFSDCEGFICNDLCKKLDHAFEKHADKAVGCEWEKSYNDMAGCVKEAAESGGFLWFH